MNRGTPRLRFGVLGNDSFAISCTKGIVESGHDVAGFFSLPAALRPNNPADTRRFAREFDIPYRESPDVNDPKTLSWLSGLDAEYLLVAWPRIVGPGVRRACRRFAIGSHPTPLPLCRGRHPIHWTVALGIRDCILTLFALGDGIDDGPILVQEPFVSPSLSPIGDTVREMNEAGHRAVLALCRKLSVDPQFSGAPQDHGRATTWRARTPHDVTLDPRMSIDMILRVVCSFSPPYPCANLVFENNVLKITAARARTDFDGPSSAYLEHGMITAVSGQTFAFKAEDGIVEVECRDALPARIKPGARLHPPMHYLAVHGAALAEKLSDG